MEGAEEKGKNLVLNKYTVLTVPNLFVLIRILCVPIYMTLLILGSIASSSNSYKSWWVYVALGVMIFAALTDVVDGQIARRFKAGSKIGKRIVKHDQGTYLGQLIDPVADKIMHIGALVGLAIAGWKTDGGPYLHWAFIIVLFARELAMVVTAFFVMNDVNVKANMLGKVASCIMSVGAIFCFFHPFWSTLWSVYTLDWIILTVGLVLNLAAAVNYGVQVIPQIVVARRKSKLGASELGSSAPSDASFSAPGATDSGSVAVESAPDSADSGPETVESASDSEDSGPEAVESASDSADSDSEAVESASDSADSDSEAVESASDSADFGSGESEPDRA